ncbi:hypothetical protein [Candidatus Palauibacter sp.]|uniref:hypothetical protein n=1 Tax=Candidatus Palauibacter sp. TaxID=3101350 RepID=UPI003B526AC0
MLTGESAAILLDEFFRDPDGNTLTYTPSTSNRQVVTAVATGSELTLVAAGTGLADVAVTAVDPGGLTATQSFAVTVPNRAPEVTVVPPLDLTSGASETVILTRYVRDPDGEPLAYSATSSDEAVASVQVAGAGLTVTAVARGETTVNVTGTDSGGLSVSQSFSVIVDGVAVGTVEPAVLLEGGEATIRGRGFSTSVANNLVLLDGIPAPVTAASATQLTIRVPRGDCLPPRKAKLGVTVLGLSDTLGVSVTPAGREDIDLDPGWYRYTFAGNGCMLLPGDPTGGEWLIGVVSTATEPSSVTPVSVSGIPGDLGVFRSLSVSAAASTEGDAQRAAREGVAFAGPIPDGFVPSTVSATDRNNGSDPEHSASRRDWAAHNEFMDRSDLLLRSLGPGTPVASPTAADGRSYSTGDTVTLFGGCFDGFDDCWQRETVRAVVRLWGANAIWLEDLANPPGGLTVAELTTLDAFYASHAKPVHDEYFGRLPDVDGNGRFLVLMTKDVNAMGVGGFVWGADFYPSSTDLSSNEAEIFYGVVPDPDGVHGRARTKQEVLDYYPSLLTHEVTHIVQLGASVLSGAGIKATWELEGGATLSEQLVAYRLFGHESTPNRGWAAYERGQAWYSEWVGGMARFFGWDPGYSYVRRVPGAPERCSWLGRPSQGNTGPCRNTRAAYDVPSMFLRHVMDRYGGDYTGGEQALMRRLTQSPHVGYASMEEVAEKRVEALLADFYMSLWMDLHGVNWFWSWDFADIWRRFSEEAWLRPYASTASAHQYDWELRGGSGALLRWSPEGALAPTSFKVTSLGGDRTPANISVWVLRIR